MHDPDRIEAWHEKTLYCVNASSNVVSFTPMIAAQIVVNQTAE